MNREEILSILRNPHGHAESTVRKARLAAADELERLAANEAGRETPLIANLAMLVRRLAHRLSLRDDGKPMAEQAMHFLIHHGLQGSPLRTPQPETFPDLKGWEAKEWLQDKYPGTWELFVDPLAVYEAFCGLAGDRPTSREDAPAEVEAFLQEHYGTSWAFFRQMVEEGLSPAPLNEAERLRRKGIDPKFYSWTKAELGRDDVQPEPAPLSPNGDAFGREDGA